MHTKTIWKTAGLAGALALAACGPTNNGDNNGDNNGVTNNSTNNGSNVATNNGTNVATNNSTNNPTNNGTNNPTNNTTAGPMTFRISIQNGSDGTSTPSPISPGVWALSSTTDLLYTAGEMDRGDGLAAIAEDGNNTPLSDWLAAEDGVASSGAFDAAPPGMSFEWTIEALPSDGPLHLAGMYVQSNDVFVGPTAPVTLFGADDAPIASQELTLGMWDVGSEANQAPGQGPDQAPRQAAMDTGSPEGLVRPFSDTTRAVPAAWDLANVTVTEDAGTFTIVYENVSADVGLLSTPLAPLFYAVHDDTWALHEAGSPAGDALESLAEDGSPAALVAEHDGGAGVLTAAAQTEDGGGSMGPIGPGGSYTIEVTPDADHPMLTIASMVVQTNDAYISFVGGGIALLDANGDARPVEAIEADLRTRLAVFDAGTEANQVPGIGSNQPPRQLVGDTGPADPEANVRLYVDSTNDLAGAMAGGFASVTVAEGAGAGELNITVTNVADSAFPGTLTPPLWAVHTDGIAMFETGMAASAELESLAEDGETSGLEGVLSGSAEVGASGSGSNPIGPDDTFTFTVTPDATNRWLSLASMIIPSNDTFLGLDSVELADDQGDLRSVTDIQTDIDAALMAYDAGTEANQAGAGGVDMAPQQSGPDTGAAEGDGTVRSVDSSLWSYPDPNDLFTITVEFVEE